MSQSFFSAMLSQFLIADMPSVITYIAKRNGPNWIGSVKSLGFAK